MKNQISTYHLFIVLLLQVLFLTSGNSQTDSKISSEPFKPSVTFATDIFPLDLNLNFCANFDPKFSIGIFGEFGLNFSNYLIAAGEHFAENGTWFKYNGRDRYDNEGYYGLVSGGLFCRFHAKKNHILDFGFQGEAFIHSDDSDDDFGGGVFRGFFTNYHFPSKWKEKAKNGKFKRRPSFGIRLSFGNFKESSSIDEYF